MLAVASCPAAALAVPQTIDSPVQVDTNAPVAITFHTRAVNDDGKTFKQCISFRNLAPKTATAISFHFEFFGLFNNRIEGFRPDRVGSFAPGILIEGPNPGQLFVSDETAKNCWNFATMSAILSNEKISVLAVRYDDGTVWSAGQPFVNAFTSGGVRLAANPGQPAFGPGSVPGAPGTVPAPGGPLTNATGGGGTSAPSVVFGAIAQLPNSTTVGTAFDQPTTVDAGYAALAMCNKAANVTTGCQLRVAPEQFTGLNRCATLAVDRNTYGYGFGVDQASANSNAFANLRAAGGVPGNNIVAAVCNTK